MNLLAGSPRSPHAPRFWTPRAERRSSGSHRRRTRPEPQYDVLPVTAVEPPRFPKQAVLDGMWKLEPHLVAGAGQMLFSQHMARRKLQHKVQHKAAEVAGEPKSTVSLPALVPGPHIT